MDVNMLMLHKREVKAKSFLLGVMGVIEQEANLVLTWKSGLKIVILEFLI